MKPTPALCCVSLLGLLYFVSASTSAQTAALRFDSQVSLQDYFLKNPNLTDFWLSNNYALTSLPALPSTLTSLKITNCPGLRSLPTLPSKLTSLEVDFSPGLKTLPTLPSTLTDLQVMEPAVDRAVADQAGLTSLPPFPSHLTSLHLYGCGALRRLPALPRTLTDLQIYNCQGLESLPSLPVDNCCSQRSSDVEVIIPIQRHRSLDATKNASVIPLSTHTISITDWSDRETTPYDVQVTINGKPTKAIFSPHQANSFCSVELLKKLGISISVKPEVMDTVITPLEIAVGPIRRSALPVVVVTTGLGIEGHEIDDHTFVLGCDFFRPGIFKVGSSAINYSGPRSATIDQPQTYAKYYQRQ